MSAVTDSTGASRHTLEVPALAYRLAGVLLIGVTLTMLSDAFLTVPNLLNVLRQTALLFLLVRFLPERG